MKDEVFYFLGNPYKGKAYRDQHNNVKQYCMIDEIINFINDSITNHTLKAGFKYNLGEETKYKFKFITGSNKDSVSAIIKNQDISLYNNEGQILNSLLLNKGTILKINMDKIRNLLSKSMSLMTYLNSINYVKEAKKSNTK